MKNTNNTLAAVQLNQVIEQLEEYDTEAMVNIYNQYADAMRYERINHNDEHTINELYSNPYDALLSASYGDYNPNHDYFTYDGYNNLSSFNFTEDDNCPIDISELAQWLISEDKLAEYDITVVTVEDMIASIEDNISDNKYMLSKLADYLGQSLHTEQVEQLKTDDEYYEYLVSHFMNELDDYSYSDLNDIINYLGINYQ